MDINDFVRYCMDNTSNIYDFARYCMDNASNIYIVEFGKVTSLAEARDKTYQMHRLWRGRFAGRKTQERQGVHPLRA